MTHAAADLRIIKCLDGLHYSFEVLHHIYSPLYELCTRLPQNGSALVPVIWRCWSFVDVVHRIREVSQALPGLSRKDRTRAAFLETTAVVEEFRHYIQHLRSELSKKSDSGFPVWGSLSWVDPDNPVRTHTIVIGARLPKMSYSGCVFDLQEQRWVSKVCLGVNAKSLNFDLIYDETQKFREYIVPWALSAFKPGIKTTTAPQIITIDLQFEKLVPPNTGEES